jgi:hypothetical protein
MRIRVGGSHLVVQIWQRVRLCGQGVVDMHTGRTLLDSLETVCRDLIDTFQPISAHAMARDTSCTSYVKPTRCNSSTMNT